MLPDVLSLVAMAIPAASSWLVNELGEPLCTMVAPPSYSYDPSGSDLPRGQRSTSFNLLVPDVFLILLCVCLQTAESFSITSI